MAIKITRQLTHEQYIKLFSNPVSGIACVVDDYNRDHRVKWCTQNIRYSKSMILGALTFWSNQLFKFYLKVTKITNPLAPHHDVGEGISSQVNYLQGCINLVKKMPDSFLFSHRYIEQIDESKYTQGMQIQRILLKDKYAPALFNEILFQKGMVDPFAKTNNSLPFDLSFTVFPNEHPYIRRTVIAEVGQTKNGNTFVIKRND